MDDDLTTDDMDETTAEIAYRQSVAAGDMVTIGKTVDQVDDVARLMIVDSYVGTKSVKVYATATATANVDGVVGDDGKITIETVPYTLKSEGTYYRAGAADNTGDLAHTLVVDPTLDPKEVFSYPGGVDGATLYVVVSPVTETELVETVPQVTRHYQLVDIDVPGPMVDAETTEMRVTASIPEAAAYKHIHFGVWAGLAEADKDGDQDIADLGIGFVQNFSGEGLTGDADMPNSGSAKYRGDWAAAVQAKDDDGNGAISLEDGPASLTAYFETDKITATLTGLATLTGKITDNTFDGDTASSINPMHDLDADADFEGTFGGGFYGGQAAEAAGIFDFAAKDDGGDNVGGAFRGAFGADKK